MDAERAVTRPKQAHDPSALKIGRTFGRLTFSTKGSSFAGIVKFPKFRAKIEEYGYSTATRSLKLAANRPSFCTLPRRSAHCPVVLHTAPSFCTLRSCDRRDPDHIGPARPLTSKPSTRPAEHVRTSPSTSHIHILTLSPGAGAVTHRSLCCLAFGFEGLQAGRAPSLHDQARLELSCAWALVGQDVVGVGELAGGQGQAAAADTPEQAVAEVLQLADPVV